MKQKMGKNKQTKKNDFKIWFFEKINKTNRTDQEKRESANNQY